MEEVSPQGGHVALTGSSVIASRARFQVSKYRVQKVQKVSSESAFEVNEINPDSKFLYYFL